ncbi:hypothetical protein F5Y12DRAFT_402056 [Xylaria sp. FL1777]|nr:hypothetical protein F5Y12DRAFT_402056 [Xylaria sp. FL1777]
MKSSRRKRRAVPPEDAQEILDARVEKVLVVRRAIVAELRTIEDRLRRLSVDVRRLSPPAPAPARGLCLCLGFGRALSRALAATRELLRTLDFEGVGDIAAGDMLRVFVDAVGFAGDAWDVLGVCERSVRDRGFGGSKDGEGFGEEICEALGLFPGVEGYM